MNKPLVIDLFCGLGGWAEGLLAEHWDCIGFDIERHEYGDDRYPAQLVLQDVLTLHGRQFKDASLIVASPPCQAYSYRAMPWKRAKALPPPCNKLFDACFRIQREASGAAGHHIPLVVENVRGAQPWVGRSRWNYGSFHLWGDVPALMPVPKALHTPAERGTKVGGDGFFSNGCEWMLSRGGPGTTKRKRATALISKIPLELSRHIGRVYYPEQADNCRSAATYQNPAELAGDCLLLCAAASIALCKCGAA